MPLPLTVSCFIKIQIGFTFLVPAHPGSPGKRAVKRVCVCVFFAVTEQRRADRKRLVYEATDLSLGGRRHVRVARRADDVLDATDRDPRRLGDARKRAGAVVREVAVDLPRLAEVVRALDEHRRRPERLEAHDEVREVELGFEVELNRHLLAPVLRLQPANQAVKVNRANGRIAASGVNRNSGPLDKYIHTFNYTRLTALCPGLPG